MIFTLSKRHLGQMEPIEIERLWNFGGITNENFISSVASNSGYLNGSLGFRRQGKAKTGRPLEELGGGNE
jgi:hypothetical protein